MAGEWLKFEANTPEKKEVFAITVAMGWDDPDRTVGKLLKVWRWFDQQTLDGNAASVTLPLLDQIIGVTGFAKAMCEVGWLEAYDGGVRLPNFHYHNGTTAKERALTAKRVAKHKSNAKGNAKGNADTVTGALPREEKRREELTTTTTNVVVVGSAAASPLPAPANAQKADCPHQEIIEIYHQVLPMCPRVRDWTPARAQQLRSRWNEHKDRQNLEYWRKFFGYVATCNFLVGKAPPGRGSNRPFVADLPWLLKSENFAKIREQRYE